MFLFSFTRSFTSLGAEVIFDNEIEYYEYIANGINFDDIYILNSPISNEVSAFSVSIPHYPDFNPNDIPWSETPSYIQDILYMPYTIGNEDSKQVPFVSVIAKSMTNITICVGINAGYYSCDNMTDSSLTTVKGPNGWFIATYDGRITDGTSVMYMATYNANTKALTSFSKLSPMLFGGSTSTNHIYYYGGYLENFSSGTKNKYDVYTYGACGIKPSSHYFSAATISGSSTILGSFYCGSYNAYTTATSFILNQSISGCYFSGFSPLTIAQQQEKTSKSILASIKEIPEKIKGFFENLGEGLGIWFTLIYTSFETLGDRIKGFFTDLLNGIINGLKSLFIPSEDYFSNVTEDLKTFFSEHLGIIYSLPEQLVSLLQKLASFRPNTDNFEITFPALRAPYISNGDVAWYELTPETTFNFNSILEVGPIGSLYSFYRVFVRFIMYMGLLLLFVRKSDRLFGGGSG